MSDQELIFMSAADLATKIKEKQISPVEAVKAYLDRITEVDSKINAYITVLAGQALAEAQQAEIDINAASMIARASDGSVRDALSILDKSLSLGEKKVTEKRKPL